MKGHSRHSPYATHRGAASVTSPRPSLRFCPPALGYPLICVGDPRKGGSRLSFLLLVLVVARAWWAVGPGAGSRWSARSAARTNDLDTGGGCHRMLPVRRTRVKALQFKPCGASG